MSSSILCGPCQYEDNIKDAKKWCTDCEDGYCEDCEKVHRSTKMSRNHTLISIADYQKIKDVSVKQICENHGERFDLYCSTHDKALCISCVNHHKSCQEVSALKEAARGSKQSTAFADVEDTIYGALENITTCIKDQELTEKHVENQEQMIRKNVKEIRQKIDNQLNVLEQKLIKDLSVKSAKCKSSLEKTLNQLKSADKKLNQLKHEIQKMKEFASDIQVFLGTREMNTIVAKEIETITRTINSALHFKIEAELYLDISSLLNRADEMGQILLQEIPAGLQFKDAKIDQAQKQVSVIPERGFRDLRLQLDISSLLNRADEMGQILLQEIPAGLQFKDAKINQAQKQVSAIPERGFGDLRLQLKQKLEILRKTGKISSYASGCLILHNDHLMIVAGGSESFENYLIEYNKEGNHINDIQLSGNPFDLTLIDSNRIAITYGNLSSFFIKINQILGMLPLRVEIKSITHGSSIKIPVNSSCWGISYQDGRLYMIAEEEGILVADVLGNILNTLPINTRNVKYIATSKDIICYTNDVENSVHCFNMVGKEIWIFQRNTLIHPAGLSVGHNNDIFVVGCASNNITLIHHDGIESKILLTAADGLNEPKSLHYDKNSKTLLVCDNMNALLYNVV